MCQDKVVFPFGLRFCPLLRAVLSFWARLVSSAHFDTQYPALLLSEDRFSLFSGIFLNKMVLTVVLEISLSLYSLASGWPEGRPSQFVSVANPWC